LAFFCRTLTFAAHSLGLENANSRCFSRSPLLAHLLLKPASMMPHSKSSATASAMSKPLSPSRGTRAARERWTTSHDPSLRERLEVAASHLRLARCTAASGVASWFVKREVELADREIVMARRTLRNARSQARHRDLSQIRTLERIAQAATELHRSMQVATRLLDEPVSSRA